jgi:type II secretory pathway component GspD/PulD (secretin)
VLGRSLQLVDGLVSAIAPAPVLKTWLQALQTKGKAQVNARPSMAAVNGKTAEIFIGSQRFIKVTFNRNGVTQERIDTVPVGIRLNVRPWTGGNKEITTTLKVDVSNIVESDPQTGVPRLGSRTASSTLRTHDGDVIVIGGLTQRQQETTHRRIPLLGDLPLIGPLFRSTTHGSVNSELVILIRPRLLDDSGHLPAAEDEQLRQRFLTEEDQAKECPPEALEGAAKAGATTKPAATTKPTSAGKP